MTKLVSQFTAFSQEKSSNRHSSVVFGEMGSNNEVQNPGKER